MDEWADIMIETQFKMEEAFGDVLEKGRDSPEQITNLISILTKNVNIKNSIKINSCKPRKDQKKYGPSNPLEY